MVVVVGCKGPRTMFKKTQPLISYPLPAKVPMKDVEFTMLNVGEVTYFALDAQNYGNLSLNIQDFAAYSKKLRVILNRYEEDISREQ